MGVASNNRFDRVLTLDTSQAETLMLTDFPTPFLGTPLISIYIYIYIYIHIQIHYIYIYIYIYLYIYIYIYNI